MVGQIFYVLGHVIDWLISSGYEVCEIDLRAPLAFPTAFAPFNSTRDAGYIGDKYIPSSGRWKVLLELAY